ncbi:HAD family hydrolase [Sinomonas sp. ASV486]|uniref:HAD family hydrolase n=1 Tax=Sinomonas sp. ASV486 TaxID=3051170 RepID=UPI0027DBF58C|nr:HAD family hydrolase [Sinomonas sp. ASV486]MDQ4489191.1 HAD family hydrolase [Sinomonas sp. ASV486]
MSETLQPTTGEPPAAGPGASAPQDQLPAHLSGLPVVACDLDRTLIYSAKALYLDGPDHAAPRLVVSEMHEGLPLSYMTRAAEDLLRELLDHAFLVPVTTRTRAQFRRVQLPRTRYAITTNGGVLLHRGEPDGAWAARVHDAVRRWSAPLEEVVARLSTKPSPGVQRVRTAEELFAYAIVERAELPEGYVAGLTAWCRERGWVVSLQGRKLYCVPASVTKEAAVAEVMERVGASSLVAAGDSLLDQGLLEMADVALRPCHGELEAAGYTRSGLRVTETPGVRAGEEIVRAALDAARAHSLARRGKVGLSRG